MTVQEYNLSVELYADGVFRFMMKLTKQDSDSDDLLQTAYEKLWRNYSNVDFEKVKSWLFTTSYRLFIDGKRKSRTDYTDSLQDTPQIGNEDNFDLKEVLNKALEMIPAIQKSCILLRDYEGYSYDEIGEILELNEAQVKVYIFRARVKMKQILTEKFNVTGV